MNANYESIRYQTHERLDHRAREAADERLARECRRAGATTGVKERLTAPLAAWLARRPVRGSALRARYS